MILLRHQEILMIFIDYGRMSLDLLQESIVMTSGKGFKMHRKKFIQKDKNFQKEIVSIQQENFKKKEIVISKMKVISGSKPSSHNEWQNSIKEFDKLKRISKIKNLKRNNNKKCWNDFRIVTKEFNTNKNNFYKNQKIELKKIIDIKKGINL